MVLSKKEKDILNYIRECIDNGIPPTVREICSELGYSSTSTAHKYLNILAEKGYIIKGEGRTRCIRLTDDNIKRVPLIGTVAAGNPILATEDLTDYISVKSRYNADELFALNISGESMIEAGINDGDIIIAKKSKVAENGEIVIALIDDEATVKTFYKENGVFRLQPENNTMDPIIVDDVIILGIVVSLIRYYR